MRSTFMGLETNKRGLFTQQTALYTTGHNISNANTLGYSRQRVNMQATTGFPGGGLHAGTMPGHLGTGVQAGSIQRVRDGFVDNQFRQESTKFGFWESKSNAISQMEDVLSEPSHHGLQKSLSEFWKSLQELATNPSEGGARKVVISKGEAVAGSFKYIHKSLSEIQTNIGNEISVSTVDINSMLQQIAQLNHQISQVEPNGYLPNDLYDARDLLIDELAMHVPIETSYVKSGGRALASAEGTVTITLKLKTGDPVGLVSGSNSATLKTTPDSLVGNAPIEGLTVVGQLIVDTTNPKGNLIPDANNPEKEINHGDLLDSGKLKSLMNSYGTNDGKGLYPDMIAELNKMAKAFAEEFNRVHIGGRDINGDTGEKFFDTEGNVPFTAGNIKVSEDLKKDPNKLAASDSGSPGNAEPGNGKNAQKLSEINSKALDGNLADPNDLGLGGLTLENFFQGVIGKLGVDGEQSGRNAVNSITLLGAVEHRRSSISAVSLDEEMVDMIRFQQAYNASARMITVVDETLDKIINGMGVVGR